MFVLCQPVTGKFVIVIMIIENNQNVSFYPLSVCFMKGRFCEKLGAWGLEEMK